MLFTIIKKTHRRQPRLSMAWQGRRKMKKEAYSIATHDSIAEKGLKIFGANYFIGEKVESPDAIIVRSHKLAVEEISDKVVCIARAGAGVNNIPVEECTKRGIVVFNTPGANANAVKELLIAALALIMSSRNILEACSVLAGSWSVMSVRSPELLTKRAEEIKKDFVGQEVIGTKLGIIGLGAIGKIVAQAATALGMEVFGYDPHLSSDDIANLSQQIYLVDKIEKLADCDYVSLHIPFTDSTKYFFNDDVINKLKRGVRVLNFARGEIVSHWAMKDALQDGRVFSYATDFAHPDLIDLPNVLSSPHLGASTVEAEVNCSIMACQQVKNFLENGNIKNSVNFPAVTLPLSGRARLLVLYKDAPGIINKITGFFAAKGVNIPNMENKSNKAGFASLLLEVDGPLGDVFGLTKIDDVIKVMY